MALVKDAKGEVVEKLARDRSLFVLPDQLKLGNFLEKMMVTLPPGKYTVECAVMDQHSGKTGTQRSEFTVAPKASGVAISSLVSMRSYTPNVKGLDPNDPLQFQGGSITPTMDLTLQERSQHRLAALLHRLSGSLDHSQTFRRNRIQAGRKESD